MLADELKTVYKNVTYYGNPKRVIRRAALLSCSGAADDKDLIYCCSLSEAETALRTNVCLLFTGRRAPKKPDCDCICVEDAVEALEVYTRIQDIIVRILTWDAEVLRVASCGSDYQLLIDVSEKMFPECLSFNSLYHNCFFDSPMASSYPVSRWPDYFNSYFHADKKVPENERGEIFKRHEAAAPMLVTLGSTQQSYLILNIFSEKLRLGQLIAPVKDNGGLNCYSEYLREISFCICTMYKNRRAEYDSSEKMLCALIQGEQIPLDQGLLDGWAKAGHMLIAAVIQPLPSQKRAFDNDILLYRNIVKHLYHDSRIVIFENTLVMIRDLTAYDLEGDTEDSRLLLENFLSRTHSTMGYSLPFYDLGQLNVFYNQAKAAASSSLLSGAGVRSYKDYLAYDLTKCFVEHRIPSYYLHPDVLLLAGEDEKSHSELLLSLYYYLLNDRSYKIASEKLHVHRNTFAYRINKVFSLISSNIDDENERLSLILSMYIYWYTHPGSDPIGLSAW